MSKNWSTKISGEVNGETVVRGYKLTDLIANANFTQAIFLTLKGVMPTVAEEKMLNGLLVASVDHGVGAPSTTAARISASVGNHLHTALAAGVASTGKLHGGAVEKAAKIFQASIDSKTALEVVDHFESKGKRIPGFGHKLYEVDPRTEALIALAKETGFSTKYIDYALEIQKELEARKSKKLPLNIDGVIACIISEMGFSPEIANSFFLIPRTVGLSAHIEEEIKTGEKVRRLDEDDIAYEGETGKSI
jgi:citryl-CoA lyase